MARGQNALSHIDFSKKQPVDKPTGKGRSRLLLQQRNKLLIARYYYHNAIRNTPFSKTIDLLQCELYIAPYTIAKVLRNEEETITIMRKKKPSVEGFKKQFPLFRW